MFLWIHDQRGAHWRNRGRETGDCRITTLLAQWRQKCRVSYEISWELSPLIGEINRGSYTMVEVVPFIGKKFMEI
jgi:hypothetical protein